MNNKHHYFASHAAGWATAPTRNEAIEKLLLTNTDSGWVRRCLKSGCFVTVFSCKVHEPQGSAYRINFYAPEGVQTSEGQNALVTYLTKKQFTIVPDPHDEIHSLRKQLEQTTTENNA